MIKYFFIKILFLIASFSCVYGESEYVERWTLETVINNASGSFTEPSDFYIKKAAKDRDLIKKSRYCLTKGDIANAMVFAKQVYLLYLAADKYFVLDVNCYGIEEEFVELVKEFYNRGYTNEALDLAKFIFNRSSAELAIVEFFFKDEAFVGSAIDLLQTVAIERGDIGLLIFQYLGLKFGQPQESEKLAKELLEIWVNQNKESLNNYITEKLALAESIYSSDYYDQLLDKYLALNSNLTATRINAFTEASLKLKSKKVHFRDRINSIPDMLGSRIRMDPRLSKRYDVSMESIQELFDTSIYEISKKSEMCFSILHAIALNAKSDSSFVIYLHNPTDNILDKRLGAYDLLFHHIIIKVDINDIDFKGIVIHEMSHKLMNTLYANQAKPYRSDNNEAANAYQEAIKELEGKLDKIKEESNYLIKPKNVFLDIATQSLLNVRDSYYKEDHICEYIVRYPQSIADETYNDPEVKELMRPLADYWNQYIQPDLEKYINENGGNSTFISDYERENIITPLFFNETLLKSYKEKIDKNPIAYLYIVRNFKAEGNHNAVKALKKKAPSLKVWRSLIAQDPLSYFQIVHGLKEIGDEVMMENVKQALPDLAAWLSIKIEDPIKYAKIIESFQASYSDNKVDLTVWKSLVAEDSMNYFKILQLVKELEYNHDLEETKKALIVEMLEKSYNNRIDVTIWQSIIDEDFKMYFMIMNYLKGMNDNDKIQEIQEISLNLNITTCSSSYSTIIESLQASYDNDEVDLMIWKSLIAEDPMNYFNIIKIIDKLISDERFDEFEEALIIEMLQENENNRIDWKSIINEDRWTFVKINRTLSEGDHHDLAEVFKQACGVEEYDNGYFG